MIPSGKQWEKWSLPSKHTAIGLVVGILSLFVGIAAWMFSSPGSETQSNVKEDIKQAINEIKKQDQYTKRYLKERLAEIEKVEIIKINKLFVARVYYFSYWYELTSSFRASVEVRNIKDLNKEYGEEEGWAKAHLLKHTDNEDHIIYLGETEYIDIGDLKNDEVYEVRVIDYSYDSDEPPTLPFRFRIK